MNPEGVHDQCGDVPPPTDLGIDVGAPVDLRRAFLSRPEVAAALATDSALQAQVTACLELTRLHSDPAGDPLLLLGIDPSTSHMGTLYPPSDVLND